jgi:hypothetical protein
MKERKKLAGLIAKRYQKARKRDKKIILNEFIHSTGYHRNYAAFVLRNINKTVRIGSKNIFKGDARIKIHRKRKPVYDEAVVSALKFIWKLMDFICGKRLKQIINEAIDNLEKFEIIHFNSEIRQKLSSISPATIDRKLKKERKKLELKGRSHTKPGTLLKHQIPIKTFADWDDTAPGFVEVDLVAHDGGNSNGDFCFTLDMTDVETQWIETIGIRNKARVWTVEAIDQARSRLPFPLLGINSDNGSEFINSHLFNYCELNHITFTRSRSNKKNDNCYVEQKNYSIVRNAVGYNRYDTDEELHILNELYSYLRLYTNHFQPAMKMMEKRRDGAKVYKRYDGAKPPYQRIMNHKKITNKIKIKMKEIHDNLNLYELKSKITACQRKLVLIQKNKNHFTKIFDEATETHFEKIY